MTLNKQNFEVVAEKRNLPGHDKSILIKWIVSALDYDWLSHVWTVVKYSTLMPVPRVWPVTTVLLWQTNYFKISEEAKPGRVVERDGQDGGEDKMRKKTCRH